MGHLVLSGVDIDILNYEDVLIILRDEHEFPV
jgi:hypothetical protein